jgi:eukaryotic-like serine/threonine-protein kinase
MRITLRVTEGPNKGRTFTFTSRDRFLVGRSKLAHFRLPNTDRYFSRIHFLVEVNPPYCRLMDMGSRNGTYVNGKEVSAADLNHGDRIKAGRTVIRVVVHTPKKVKPEPPPPQIFADTPTQRQVPARVPDSGEVALPARMNPVPDPQLEESRAKPKPLVAGTPSLPTAIKAVKGCRVCQQTMYEEGRPRPTNLFPAELAPICEDCQVDIRNEPQPMDDHLFVRRLGAGGMGVVYLTLRKEDGAVLALKTILPAVDVEPRDVRRFLREASILSDLVHPNIVPFRGMGKLDGRPYLTMDYIRGQDAASLLKNEGPLPVQRAVAILIQVLDALEYAHARNYVHRDIKPANIFIRKEDHKEIVQVGDFGLARIFQASKLSGVTLPGDTGGTLAFVAPEQITNFREASPPADQYAAAATLYTLMTGTMIYDLPGSVEKQMMAILYEEPIPVRERRPDIPQGLEQILQRALEREPADRYPDATAMREALLPYAGSS